MLFWLIVFPFIIIPAVIAATASIFCILKMILQMITPSAKECSNAAKTLIERLKEDKDYENSERL